MTMTYRVTTGKLAKENGCWNPDGTAAVDVREFGTWEEAEEFFAGCDPREAWRDEHAATPYKPGMGRVGYYAEIEAIRGDLCESRSWRQWTADDEAVWSANGEGWYRAGFSDGGRRCEPVWCECRSDFDAVADYVSTEFRVGYVEYLGDGEEPVEP